MANRIQLRYDTAAAAAAVNELLLEGEMFLETDTRLYKIGDGVTLYNALPYGGLVAPYELLTMLELFDEPAAPPAGQLRVYGKGSAGRVLLKTKGPSGVDTPLQPALFANGMFFQSPGATTAPTVNGGVLLATSGTRSHPALVATNARTAMFRWQNLSAATANAAAGESGAIARYWRGDGPGLGGFYFRVRFAVASTTPLQRGFLGMSAEISATPLPTQTIPTLLNCVGVGFDSGDATFSIIANDSVGAPIKIDTGMSCTDTSLVYDLAIFAPPNAQHATVELRPANGNVEFVYEVSDNDLPSSGTFLTPRMWINNGGTAAAVQLDFARIYVETDY